MATKKVKKAEPKAKSDAPAQVICVCGSVNFHAYSDGALVCSKCGAKK